MLQLKGATGPLSHLAAVFDERLSIDTLAYLAKPGNESQMCELEGGKGREPASRGCSKCRCGLHRGRDEATERRPAGGLLVHLQHTHRLDPPSIPGQCGYR